jgi:hypothetical protein
VIGQFVERQKAGIGEVRAGVEPGDGRDGRAPSGVDEDLGGCEERVADGDFVIAGETRVALNDGAFLGAAQPLFDAHFRLAGDLAHPGFHFGHVHADVALDEHAVVRGPVDDVGGARAGDESLGRNAAGIHAGAAETVALDDGDAAAGLGESHREGWAGLSGADYDCVESHVGSKAPGDRRCPSQARIDRLGGLSYKNFTTTGRLAASVTVCTLVP